MKNKTDYNVIPSDLIPFKGLYNFLDRTKWGRGIQSKQKQTKYLTNSSCLILYNISTFIVSSNLIIEGLEKLLIK